MGGGAGVLACVHEFVSLWKMNKKKNKMSKEGTLVH